MPASAALPRSLQLKIHSLARRVRILRVVHGGGLLLVTLVVLLSAALLVDYGFGLPPAVRLALLFTWAAVGITSAIRGIVLPLCRKLSPDGLAALIEERYPDLGERLTTAIEVARSQATYHGSPALVALLFEDTETRTRSLNVSEAAPARDAVRFLGTAVFLLSLAVFCALLWPRYSFELGRRFLLPWRTPGALVLYSLQVAPGNTIAAKGRPLAFSVTIVPEQDNVSLPQAGTLVITDAAGSISRQPLLATRPDFFTLVLDKVPGDLSYYIEAGGAISDTYQVRAIEPVELAADSPTIVITPPLYAQNHLEPQTVHGFADLSALQHSRIHLDFRFTRPTRTATLEWPASEAGIDRAKGVPLIAHPLALTDEGYRASGELPALTAGSYRLVLVEDHGIRTELEPRLLNVHIDQPPAFMRIVINDNVCLGSEGNVKPAQERLHAASPADETKIVLPSESLRLDIGLSDDVAIERTEVEYHINDGSPQRELIPLQSAGSRQANGQFLFQLAGKRLHEGDTLRYRIRAADNRSVPEAGLGPNVIYFPPGEQWLTLKIADKAQPLRQQEIAAQREDLDRRLGEIKDLLLGEQRDLEHLQPEARPQTLLGEEQTKQLKHLREQNREIENSLRELARVAAGIRPLQMLADQAGEVADHEMRLSDQALQQAETESQPQLRDHRFDESGKEIAAALGRVEEMRRANAQLAQERMDLAELEGLADRQQELAERASRDLASEPGSRNRDQQLKGDQKEIANELQHLAAQSEPIRKALDAARAEEARQLAAKAREVAEAERDLLDTERQSRQREKAARLNELARKQEELAERANQLAKETRAATQAAAMKPLRPEAASQAARALRDDNTGEALRLEHQNRDELERLAKELEQAIERAREPREAARQLARLQEAIRQSVNEAESKEPLKGEQLEAVRRDQEALNRAVENLPVPALDSATAQQQREAMERTAQAAEALEDHNARHAEARMAQAEEALRQLAEQLPPGPLPRADKAADHRDPATPRGQVPETTPVPQNHPNDKQARQNPVRREQADETLPVPARDPSTEKLKREATEQNAQAGEALEDHNARHADARMPQSDKASEQPAEQLRPGPRPQTDKAADHPDSAPARGQVPETTSVPQGLPNHEQARQIRELAQQQGELIGAVQDLMSQETQGTRSPRENPLSELSREQAEVAHQAADLARAVGQEQGPEAPAAQRSQQASQSAQQTSKHLQAGAVQPAYEAGTRTAQELKDLADQLSQPAGARDNSKSADTSEQTRRLGHRQEEINRRLEALRSNPDAQRAQQQARQQELEQQTGELSAEWNQLAQQMADSPLARQSAERAAESGHLAQAAMSQARNSDQQGNQRRAQQARQEAAHDLDQAASQSELAAQQIAAALDLPQEQADPALSPHQPGHALQQAQQQMSQAETQLGQGRHPAAVGAMQHAAQSMQQAARQLSQQRGQPNSTAQSNGRGVSAAGRFEPSLFGSDAKEYAGKRWGELPGELRTKIIQDMQARYGDDYARIIKLYFEQIADTSK